MPAVAITDINGVYGIPRAYEVAKKIPHLKLITGAELTLSDHPNLTLLVQNRASYGLLCVILTALHSGKEKGKGSLKLAELFSFLEKDKRSSGLIAFSEVKPTTAFSELKEMFSERLYLPLCRYLDGLDEKRTCEALEQSRKYGIKVFATNDVHYHLPERKRLQDCLTCIREGVTLQTAGKKLFKNSERYLKSPLQMRALFKEMPQMIHATEEIAERCTFSLSELTYTYPVELIPDGHTPQSYLEDLVLKGAHQIYKGVISSAVDEQIRKELALIQEKNYASYFLTIYDVVEFARRKNIICQGRGSAANSITCYCLGVTAIDPVRMNLLFERFISEERDEPPDIDVDFEHERREEIIQYIYSRYGRDRAAMVSAVRTYQRKSSFLELSKAIGIPVGTISASALKRDFEKLARDLKEKKEVLQSLREELLDFPRHLSIHSGGFTLSHEPITETVPVEPARMKDRTIIQWDKNDLDTVGLLKLDILSLGFLTALHKCADYIGIHWHDIPSEDKATYDMICKAETEGCFQIESRAQKAMLPRTQPRTFYDLVVQVAIVRPGPNVGEMITPYMKRRDAARAGNPYRLPDPDLEPALGRTYGIPIFQEQIMKVAILKAGFSAGEADQLRRAIASWRSAEAVETMGGRLYQGLIKSGVDKKWADELFGYLKGYAHYGFPESHAASFAKIAYCSAYLKCHHPAEFLCALVNSQPMGFYAIDTLINEAKRQGVRVLPIDPNLSDWDAKMEKKNTVRMGFRNVRKIHEQDIRWMNATHERELKESDIKGSSTQEEMHRHFLVLESERIDKPFESLFDFIKRTKLSRDVIELMALADVFSCFGCDQRHTFWNSIAFHNLFDQKNSAQLLLFSENPMPEGGQIFEAMTLLESISADYRALGYSVRGNPMTALRKSMPELPKLTSRQAKTLRHGTQLYYAGILTVNQRPPTAKGVAFLTVEDDEGSLDFIVKKETYEKYEDIIRNNRFLKIKGKVQRRGNALSIIVDEVSAFTIRGASEKSVTHGATSRNFGSPIKL